LYRDLAKRPLVKILCRDLLKRTKILLGDRLERLNRESSYFEIVYRELLWRSHEISDRHVVQIALTRDLAQQLLHKPVWEISHTIFYRDFRKGICRI